MSAKVRMVITIVVLVGVVGFVALWRGYRGNWPLTRSHPPDQALKDFDGTINYQAETYDPVLSDLCVRGAKALQAGDAVKAEAIYRERIAKYPKDPSGYNALGATLYFQKKYQAAREQYDIALQLDPASGGANYGLGCVALEERQYPEAREQLEKALALGRNDRATHRVLAMVYDELGDEAQALLHYEKASALRGSAPEDEFVNQRLKELRR